MTVKEVPVWWKNYEKNAGTVNGVMVRRKTNAGEKMVGFGHDE